ncbi:unnamed protein product [Schistocephalus solidus]|uniref:Dehydrogenase/reductase SDR family member 1 n=1 Tax=Schistocephalus solidus TaxID=70667 RepID=A0A3P7DBS1_SCHSO|nr:unnamed protein product [Schistocephalus solidus]
MSLLIFSMGSNKLPNLKGCVCLVTGASRGIGRGVSLALGECGATVYLTGRTLKPKGDVKEGNMGGSLEETAAEVTARGGVAIPVAVDHTDDGQVVNLFSRIRREQKGRLDLLVNNAFAAAGYISSHRGVSYWKLEAGESVSSAWDIVNRVGLRNHYICATLATRMMLECRGELTSDSDGGENEPNDADSQRPGLIINISSLGGLRYLFNVPYGVGKAAMDRMAADMAHELREKKKSIAVLSLWPGIVKTEHMLQSAQDLNSLSTTIEKLGDDPPCLFYLLYFLILRMLLIPGRPFLIIVVLEFIDFFLADSYPLRGGIDVDIIPWVVFKSPAENYVSFPSEVTLPSPALNAVTVSLHRRLTGVRESPELTGFVIARLLDEPKGQLLSRSGRVVFVADSALQMGIRDIDGKWPLSVRSLRFLLEATGWTRLSRLMPGFVRVPYSVFTWIGSKF